MKDVKIYVDHRRWKLKDQYKHAKVNMTVEYVSEVSKKEKLTVHFVKNTTPEFYVSIQEEGIKLFDGEAKLNVFDKKKNEQMYEFILKNDSAEEDQHELVRVIKVEDGYLRHPLHDEKGPDGEKTSAKMDRFAVEGRSEIVRRDLMTAGTRPRRFPEACREKPEKGEAAYRTL